jgi:hypothetical protein
MSNLIINWRFGTYHLQIGFYKPFIRFVQNEEHVKNPPAKWFEQY